MEERALVPDETLLVAQARAGSTGAFEELLARHDRELRALAFRLLDDRAAMDDVLQDAYVKAFVALRDFTGRSAFGTWLYRIVYNTALDELRRRSRRRAVRWDDVPEIADRAQDPADAASIHVDLASALEALPPDLRAIVLMVDAAGMDYGEAAEVLGVPPGTVASRLNRARRMLRLSLSAPGAS